jgi:hypothetical protein
VILGKKFYESTLSHTFFVFCSKIGILMSKILNQQFFFKYVRLGFEKIEHLMLVSNTVTLNSKSVTEIDNKLPDNLKGALFCLLG